MGTKRWWVTAATAAILGASLVAPPAIGAPEGNGAPAGDPITDPIPEDPEPAELGLVLEEYAQLPETDTTPPTDDERLMRHNRINYIGDVPDGSGRQYVPDLNGPMYLLDDGRQHEYLDLREYDEHFFSGRGMGSGAGFITFHPDFEKNGKFYTVHSVGEEGIAANDPTYPNQPDSVVQSVVTEWTADDPSANTFSGTHREIFRYGFGTHTHAVQQIDFNPTAEPGDEDYGLLYMAVGDGGIGLGTDIPQDLSEPGGKIFRIDPEGDNGPNGQYGIPESNPFVGGDGALGEIYALGMRDPHRFTWDPEGGNEMYLGHIGQRALEAVYEVEKGDNLGWAEREGRFVFDPETQCALFPLPPDDAKYGYTYPVAAYDHDPPYNWPCNEDSGHALSGGQVYRGDAHPELEGKYVFGDLVDGEVMSTETDEMQRGAGRAPITQMQLFDTDGQRMRMSDFVGDGRVDLRFGADSEGELYLLAKANGAIWKVTDVKQAEPTEVTDAVSENLVSHYDFEHPFAVDGVKEGDQGSANTLLDLINGGEDMRVDDGAFPGSNNAVQLKQVNPGQVGNDDWKAGVWDGDADGVESLDAFNAVDGITVMGWVKMTGENPSPDPSSDEPGATYNSVGLAGVLSGESDGHDVRALLELIEVDGELRLVALGRRIDDGDSQTFAAKQDWRELLPQGEWVHLAATFDYTTGDMALYRNGEPVPGFYVNEGDPWQVDGSPTSATNPRGIKIGGSYPQNESEKNPCNCRMDSLMFLDTAAGADTIAEQYARFRGE